MEFCPDSNNPSSSYSKNDDKVTNSSNIAKKAILVSKTSKLLY